MSNKKQNNKPVKISKEQLYTELINLRVKKGYSKTALIDYVQNRMGVGRSMAYNYVKGSSEALGEAYNKVYTDTLADSVVFLDALKQKAFEEDNLKMALDIQRELNKVNQLYIQKQEITLKAEQPLFTDNLELKEGDE